MMEERDILPQPGRPAVIRRFLECRCLDVERGGCWCEDDGTEIGVAVQIEDHDPHGVPGRARVRKR